MNQWRYFKLEEFGCKCGCGENRIDPQFVTELDALRAAISFPLVITSGYRCPAHNLKVSTTGENGPHTTGRAVDIAIDGERAALLVRVAMHMRFTGIGVKQHGVGRFVHLDNLPNASGQPRPRLWSYP